MSRRRAAPRARGRRAGGYAYVDGDLAYDGALARAAAEVVVSHERLGPAEPWRAAISRLWIDATVHAPAGAWPTACHPLAVLDRDAVAAWAAAGAGAPPALLEPRA